MDQSDIAQSGGGNIFGNTVTLDEGGKQGIVISVTEQLKIAGNVVRMNNPATNQHGIKLEGGDQNLLEMNYIYSSGGNDAGIHATHSSRSLFWCNGSSGTGTGLQFEGMLAGKLRADVSGNSMTDHATGPKLGAGAVIGKQKHRGNIWEVPFSLIGAENQGNAVSSQFIVDAAVDARFMPPTSFPPNWFLNDIGGGEIFTCASRPDPVELPEIDINQDLEIIRGNIGEGDHANLNNWIAQTKLLDRLISEGNPHGNNTEVQQFLSNAETNGLADFVEVRQAMRSAFQVNESTLAAIQEKEEQIFELLDQLRGVEQSLAVHDLTPTDSIDLTNEKMNILTELSQNTADKNALHDGILQNRLPQISALITQNNNLLAFQPWEQHEKTVNDVVLRTIGAGNLSFTNQQLSNLQAIADLCPLSDGEAVFQARVLLEVVAESPSNYDDETICNPSQNREQAKKNQTIGATQIQIYPNPSSNWVTIDYRLSKLAEKRLEILDIHGKKVLEMPLETEQGRLNIPLLKFQSGVFWVQIPGAGKASSQKLIFTKD